MNPYIRAAARNEALRQQALERLHGRDPNAVTPATQVEVTDARLLQRARDPETGQFLADDPSTPDVNEAWG